MMILTYGYLTLTLFTSSVLAFSCLKNSASRTSNALLLSSKGEDGIEIPTEVDVVVVGAGLGGLCAGAILNTLYRKRVAVFESHYLAGGCAHAFDRQSENGETFTFDSGPTILLGCSEKPFSALRQVLDAVGQSVDWIRYSGWGMIENPTKDNELRWTCELGPNLFQQGPLTNFGGSGAVEEFESLRSACRGLIVGSAIPAMAMRPGPTALIPLLRYFDTFVSLIQQGPELTGTFAPYINGPKFVVKDKWLRNWLDALAFSLSGLPASRTSAAAMAFVLEDMHREGAALDYPKGGLGSVIDALVRGLEQGNRNSKLYLRKTVKTIDFDESASRTIGVTLTNGKTVMARDGVICNAPIWSLNDLLVNEHAIQKLNGMMPLQEGKTREPKQTWFPSEGGPAINVLRDNDFKIDSDGPPSLLYKCDTAEMTGSFLHLHVAINATGLDMSKLQPHYTVMDRGLGGSDEMTRGGLLDGPCGELNMIAVSNPCVLDRELAPEGFMVLHAYGAGNEPYFLWEGMKRSDPKYAKQKKVRSESLWRALESVIPDVRARVVLDLVGSPLTHERFLRRPRGTYGAATEDYLPDGSTPISNFLLAGDSIFPGIGVPAVAISGASAANGFVNPLAHWLCLNDLKTKNAI
jgi:phytoene dehydrogenase-like protein